MIGSTRILESFDACYNSPGTLTTREHFLSCLLQTWAAATTTWVSAASVPVGFILSSRAVPRRRPFRF